MEQSPDYTVRNAGNWIDGWKRIGVELERIENDPVGRVTRWTDYSVG